MAADIQLPRPLRPFCAVRTPTISFSRNAEYDFGARVYLTSYERRRRFP
jgi:hypothetical protein